MTASPLPIRCSRRSVTAAQHSPGLCRPSAGAALPPPARRRRRCAGALLGTSRQPCRPPMSASTCMQCYFTTICIEKHSSSLPGVCVALPAGHLRICAHLMQGPGPQTPPQGVQPAQKALRQVRNGACMQLAPWFAAWRLSVSVLHRSRPAEPAELCAQDASARRCAFRWLILMVHQPLHCSGARRRSMEACTAAQTSCAASRCRRPMQALQVAPSRQQRIQAPR